MKGINPMVKATIESRLKKMKKTGREWLRCNKTDIVDTALEWVNAERRGEIRVERLTTLQEVKLVQLEDGTHEWRGIYDLSP
jgi:hypothetical protein